MCAGHQYNSRISDQGTSVNILSLTRVSSKDSGTYTCHAYQSVTGWPDRPYAQVIYYIYILNSFLNLNNTIIMCLLLTCFLVFSIRSNDTS